MSFVMHTLDSGLVQNKFMDSNKFQPLSVKCNIQCLYFTTHWGMLAIYVVLVPYIRSSHKEFLHKTTYIFITYV